MQFCTSVFMTSNLNSFASAANANNRKVVSQFLSSFFLLPLPFWGEGLEDNWPRHIWHWLPMYIVTLLISDKYAMDTAIKQQFAQWDVHLYLSPPMLKRTYSHFLFFSSFNQRWRESRDDKKSIWSSKSDAEHQIKGEKKGIRNSVSNQTNVLKTKQFSSTRIRQIQLICCKNPTNETSISNPSCLTLLNCKVLMMICQQALRESNGNKMQLEETAFSFPLFLFWGVGWGKNGEKQRNYGLGYLGSSEFLNIPECASNSWGPTQRSDFPSPPPKETHHWRKRGKQEEFIPHLFGEKIHTLG